MEYDLGDVGAHGQARRVNPAWGRAQDAQTASASRFLRARLPPGQQIVREREARGTRWIVKRGPAPVNIRLGSDFMREYGKRAHFAAECGDVEEYSLDHCSPQEAWRMNRGKGCCMLYLFATIAALGLTLMYKPMMILGALELD